MHERLPERRYVITTPLGRWRAVVADAGLRELSLPRRVVRDGWHPGRGGGKGSVPELRDQEGALGRRVLKALAERLDGKRTNLPWSDFDLSGRPPFFTRAWKALYAIPFGEVRTYSQIAKSAGSPQAVRAAGGACGANPIVLFIPCHRVIASNGPGGFGAGLDWKRRLLALEGRDL